MVGHRVVMTETSEKGSQEGGQRGELCGLKWEYSEWGWGVTDLLRQRLSKNEKSWP